MNEQANHPTGLEAAYDDAPREVAPCTACGGHSYPIHCVACDGWNTLAAQRVVRLKAYLAAKAVRS